MAWTGCVARNSPRCWASNCIGGTAHEPMRSGCQMSHLLTSLKMGTPLQGSLVLVHSRRRFQQIELLAGYPERALASTRLGELDEFVSAKTPFSVYPPRSNPSYQKR